MDKLIEILEEIQPDADYETCDTLIDDGILDSFAILSIVSELQDEFDITITPADICAGEFQFRRSSVGDGLPFERLNSDNKKPQAGT